MNASDIHNVTFDRVMRGYKPEEVDEYLDKVAAELERLQAELRQLKAEKEDAEQKMFILAEKVDQYRNDEETLKTALLNAQRMGESVIHEAKQKAETIIYDATNKANQARDAAIEQVAEQEMLLARMKAEVARFKGEILNLYKQHIESLSMLPEEEKRKPEAPPADSDGEADADAAAQPSADEEIGSGEDASLNDYETIEFERE